MTDKDQEQIQLTDTVTVVSSTNKTVLHDDSGDTTDFISELRDLINKYSMENESNTPDFILAHYLMDCLRTWNHAQNWRAKWYGLPPEPQECHAEHQTATAMPYDEKWLHEIDNGEGWKCGVCLYGGSANNNVNVFCANCHCHR